MPPSISASMGRRVEAVQPDRHRPTRPDLRVPTSPTS